jgi:SAM-dependent methyltransferase
MEIRVVASIERFRRLAGDLPASQDTVLEIGCSTGETTRILAQRCARVVAVDVGEAVMTQAQSSIAACPNVTLVQMDGRDGTTLGSLLSAPDLIFLDIGGKALLGNVASLLRVCLRTFAPRTIVVRSLELAAVLGLVTEIEPPDEPDVFRPLPSGGLRSALPDLLDLSRSYVATDRIFAARKLRQLAIPEAQARLQEMADDPDRRVRQIASRDRGKRREEAES